MLEFLKYFADWFTFGVLHLEKGSHLAVALNFFIYETIKIFILLFIVISLMAVANAYFPVEKLRNFLHRKKLYGMEYLLASVFGAVTPFCSCSSVPLFIGFVQGGIPLGVNLSFLITSPLVNEVALAMFLGMFGLKITLIYAVSGILLGTIGGMALGRLRLQRYLSDWVRHVRAGAGNVVEGKKEEHKGFIERLPGIRQNIMHIIKGIAGYVVMGIAIGATIHGYVPENFFQHHLSAGQWWTVPVAVILAVPMYAGATSIVPVMQVFVAKGVPLGTAIAFMMGTVGLSLPEATMLKKVMTMRLIIIFFGTVALFIIFSGFLFNAVL